MIDNDLFDIEFEYFKKKSEKKIHLKAKIFFGEKKHFLFKIVE